MADIEKKVGSSLVEVFGSVTTVCPRLAEQFPDHNPPSHLRIYRLHDKFASTRSFMDMYRGNVCQGTKLYC